MHKSNLNKNNQSNTIVRFKSCCHGDIKRKSIFLKCINTDILLFMSMNQN